MLDDDDEGYTIRVLMAANLLSRAETEADLTHAKQYISVMAQHMIEDGYDPAVVRQDIEAMLDLAEDNHAG